MLCIHRYQFNWTVLSLLPFRDEAQFSGDNRFCENVKLVSAVMWKLYDLGEFSSSFLVTVSSLMNKDAGLNMAGL